MARWKTREKTATIKVAFEEAHTEIQCLHEEMETWAESLEEYFEGADRTERVREAADQLDNGNSYLDDIDVTEAQDFEKYGKIEITYQVMSPYGRKAEPRWMRLGNAQAIIEEVLSVIGDMAEEADEDPPDWISDLQDAQGEMEAIDFPSAFG